MGGAAGKKITVSLASISGSGAGKTTFMYKMKQGEIITTTPSIGFNVENVSYKGLTFEMWDLGGGYNIEPLWKQYFDVSHCIIFMVDSENPEIIDKEREMLQKLMGEKDYKKKLFLIMANKQDLPRAMSVAEITEKLCLNEFSNRTWHIQPTSVINGEGLNESMDWIIDNLR